MIAMCSRVCFVNSSLIFIWCTGIVVIQTECLREVLDVVTQTSSCRGWHRYICQLRVCNSLFISDKKVYLQPIARAVCCTFVMVLNSFKSSAVDEKLCS